MARDFGLRVERARAAASRSTHVAHAIVGAIRRPRPEVYPHAGVARAGHPQRRRAGVHRSLRAPLRPAPRCRRRARDVSATGAVRRRAGDRARRPRAPAAARSFVGGWVRDRLLGHPSKDIDVEVFGIAPERLERSFAVRAGEHRRRELHGLQGRRRRRVAAAARVEGRPRAQGIRRHGRSGALHRGGRAAARLHHQRDLLGSADRTNTSTRSTAAAISSAASCGPSIRAPSPTTACACCAPSSSPRGSSSRSIRARGEICRRIALDDLPAERIWGEIEKLLLKAGAAVHRVRARARPGRHRAPVSRAGRARRLPAGARMASRGRRLGAHAAGHRRGAHAHRRSAAPAADRRHARRGVPRPRQAADDRVRRRPHPIARSRGGGRAARRRRLLDRLNVHSMHGLRRPPRRCSASSRITSSRACSTSREPRAGDGAFRRLAQKVDLELLARVAKADCEGRGGGFDCSAMDWFVERARALGVEHAPPEPLVKGRHLLALGVKPGPARRRGAARRLRTAARRARHLVRRGVRGGVRSGAGTKTMLKTWTRRAARLASRSSRSRRGRCPAPQQKEPIGRFAVDVRGRVRAPQGGTERRDRARRAARQPPAAQLGARGGRARYPLRAGKSRSASAGTSSSRAGPARRRRRPRTRRMEAPPTVHRHFQRVRARSVAELRPQDRLELHQRRHRTGDAVSSIGPMCPSAAPRGGRRSTTAPARDGSTRTISRSPFDVRWYSVAPHPRPPARSSPSRARRCSSSAGASR